MSYDVLIVDDQEDIRQILAKILQDEGYDSRQASNGFEALEQVKTRRPHLILLDVWLNDNRLDGIQTLELLKQIYPDVPIIMISGHGTIETAVMALKKGAYDFIEKPFKTDRLLNLIKRGIEFSHLSQEIQHLRQEVGQVQELIGKSPPINNLQQSIEKVSKTSSRVLIEGPAGSGKLVVARLIHHHSTRSLQPFIEVNCANLSHQHFEEEFFGKETQLSSVETTLKIGLLEKADRGTLFLDGVDDLPLETQSKILQILQDHHFYRVGGAKPLHVDVRIISATSVPLLNQVKKGLFREDLYYRLNVVPFNVPSIQNRRQDIMLLAHHFIDMMNSSSKIKKTFSKDAQISLEAYNWPGNVRQLKNTIEWVSIMYANENIITAQMLPAEIQGTSSAPHDFIQSSNLLSLQLKEAREEFEKSYLGMHLKRFNGNISRTAQAVGMERTALHRKIKMLGLGADTI